MRELPETTLPEGTPPEMIPAEAAPSEGAPSPATPRWGLLRWLRPPGWEGAAYLLLIAVALGMHLWDLGGRAIHYDEAIHVYYAYRLAEEWEYTHAAWCHGPFLYHLSAFFFKLFGDSEYTARLPFALFGVALVGLPYLFRRHMGRWGALATAVLLAFSPVLLYYGRFARNDIYIAFWTVALLILAWRYFHEGKDRYLYLGSAVLALAFTTKETAFIMAGLFGVVFFVMALPQLVSWVRYRTRFRGLGGPAGFLILMVTLTLPQWTPLVSFFQEPLGITLVNSNDALGPVGQALGVGIFVSLGLIALAMVVSVVVGLLWRGRMWIYCALIYYAIWFLLYTTVFKNPLGGFMSGMWESMGYWLAQQEVARGGQPWYFYFALGLNYEFLPFLLALPALVYYAVKRDRLGMALGLLSLLTLVFYIYAGEKMPWLIVEVTLPLILLVGKFLGDILGETLGHFTPAFRAVFLVMRVAETRRTRLRGVAGFGVETGKLFLVLLVPALIALGGWLLVRYLDTGTVDGTSWALIGAVSFLGLLIVCSGWRAGWMVASRLAVLGTALLLLGFGVLVGARASYTYNDAPIEILVYAQGSYEMREVADQVREAMEAQPEGSEVAVDYELWYPYQWYARNDDYVRFYCYKDQSEDAWVAWCKPMQETPKAAVVLLNVPHGERDVEHLRDKYERTEKRRNLLWFPQLYRIPDIQAKDGFLTRRSKEVRYLWESMKRREAWDGFFDYLIQRRMDSPWWFSDFYAYFPKGG